MRKRTEGITEMAKEKEKITRSSPVTVLSGVGETRAKCYAKMGILTLGDLVTHYPRAYENRGDVRLLSEAPDDVKHAFILTVATQPKCIALRSHKSFLKFRAYDDSASCEIVFFNQDYLRNAFEIGAEYRFFGKVERVGYNGLRMSSPAVEKVREGERLPDLHPVWRMTEGISPKQIAKDIASALSLLATDSEDFLPPEIRIRRSLCTLSFAERNIHLPEDAESLKIARRRLVYDEFFETALGSFITRERTKSHDAPICRNGNLSELFEKLPYRLTSAQNRVIGEIQNDMASDIPMRRMIVGDVGCGKTVCALCAMLFALQSGHQAILMAPTEILARQHFSQLSTLLSALGYGCQLLVGATSAKEKKKIKEGLACGSLPAVIGTHALLTDNVVFSSVGVIVTDEQHRFGALQRAKLTEKSSHAHLLVMSATPIPRSLALALYGDLNLSRIDEMPKGRQRVDTYVVDDSYRERLNGFIRKQISDGGQVYVVCPAVEENDELEPDEVDLFDIVEGKEKEEKPPLRTAVEYSEVLAKEFPDLSVAFLHGRMKSAEKDAVMCRFAEGDIQILVSTTVIEVGVNVPNACLMIVENAERFGLSQLHQLRGRVGRGTRKSYCVLVTGVPRESLGESAKARLEVLRTTYDGYRIAEEDLKQRGPGDFLHRSGSDTLRQSGDLTFRLADAREDTDIMTTASTDAKDLIACDPELYAHPLLRSRVEDFYRLADDFIS